jgi:hypothetical protein
MKLSGHLTIEVVDATTNEVINTIEQSNIITDNAYTNEYFLRTLIWSANTIFISNETALPTRTKASIQCLGCAYKGTGQPDTQVFHTANPPYISYTQRLDAVSVARTFQTVGLTNQNVGQVVNTVITPWAYLLLNQPCTQEVSQILNFNYRITVQNSTISGANRPLYPQWINDMCFSMSGFNSYLNINQDYRSLRNMTACAPLPEYQWWYLPVATYGNIPAVTGTSDNQGNWVTWQGNQATNFYRQKCYWSFPRANNSDANGRVFNGILSGSNYTPKTTNEAAETKATFSAYSSSTLSTTSNLQSAFAYRSVPPTTITACFLPDNTPTGSGSLTFSEAPWTGVWPTTYRIRITESGAPGTAKYVLGVRNFTSYYTDSYYTYCQSNKAYHPYIQHLAKPYNKAHGWQLTMPISAIDNVWTVQADRTGVSIVNQFTGQHYDLDSTTTPALPITDMRQYAVDAPRSLIYVACSSTGLWRINYSNLSAITVTNVLFAQPVYAVDTDKNGIVYAVTVDASISLILTSSASNYTANLGFTGTLTSWLYILVNRIHADTRIAIVVRNNTITNQLRGANIYWWSLANGTSTNTYLGNLVSCGESQNSVAWVRNNDSRLWCSDGTLLEFNTASQVNPSAAKYSLTNIQSYISDIGYDPETYKLLDGTQLPTTGTRYLPHQICQDYWGAYISSPNGYAQIYHPATGATFTNINNQGSGAQGLFPFLSVIPDKAVCFANGIHLSSAACHYQWANFVGNTDQDWIWYKWNGTSWIPAVTFNANTNTWINTIDSASSRTTSTSNQALLDGISVRFTAGLTEPSFVVGEVYDQHVARGMFKTNDTSMYVETATIYSQPVFNKVSITPTTITAANNYGVVVDGAPGNTAISSAVSAIAVNPLYHSLLPEYDKSNMYFEINSIPVTTVYAESINTLPAANTLTAGQVIVYRNGLIVCSSADVNKTLTGYFSYVARSD